MVFLCHDPQPYAADACFFSGVPGKRALPGPCPLQTGHSAQRVSFALRIRVDIIKSPTRLPGSDSAGRPKRLLGAPSWGPLGALGCSSWAGRFHRFPSVVLARRVFSRQAEPRKHQEGRDWWGDEWINGSQLMNH